MAKLRFHEAMPPSFSFLAIFTRDCREVPSSIHIFLMDSLLRELDIILSCTGIKRTFHLLFLKQGLRFSIPIALEEPSFSRFACFRPDPCIAVRPTPA